MEKKYQVLIFSRRLIEDAHDQGYIAKFDQILNELVQKGVRLCFITQMHWVEVKGLDQLTAPIEKLKTENRLNTGLAKKILSRLDGDIKTSLVISTSDADIIMAANSGLMSVTAGWVQKLEDKPKNNGINIQKLDGLVKAVELMTGTEPWYSIFERENFKIYSLLNAGDYQNIKDLLPLIGQMKEDLKEAPNSSWVLFKFLLASSLLKTDELKSVNYVGIYPSSSCRKPEEELIYKYYKTSKYAISNRSKLQPIFIRHKPSAKRHSDRTIDRNDPNFQLESIHINPYYKGKLRGKTVLIIDDFTTNGTSFWVANALLKKAGASKVFCVALGKYGNRIHEYEIDLTNRNPFVPSGDRVEYNCFRNDDSVRNPKALNEVLDKYKSIK